MWFPALHAGFFLAFVAATSSGQLVFPSPFRPNPTPKPGETCSASSGKGTCTEFRLCSPEDRKFATYSCGFNLRKFYVCCPVKKAEELNLLRTVSPPPINFQCGKRGTIPIRFGFRRKRADSRTLLPGPFFGPDDIHSVVGGIESIANSWPWMILLGRKVGPRNQYFCSAVLINNRYALTAAHCILDPSPFFARLGEHDHSRIRVIPSNPEDVNVEDVIIHPKYDVSQGYNDIAILKLSRDVDFRNEIRPVCLPWGSLANEPLLGQEVTITGWGSERFGGTGSPVLRQVQVSVFESSVCQKSYSTIPEYRNVFPQGMNEANIVCAGNALGGKDSCQGDSGGPIVHRQPDDTFSLAGIISKGYGCGKQDFPGLYTPVRNYETLNWIKTVAF